MAKGSSNDVFAPVVWASEKAKEYWLGVAKEPLWLHARLMEGYCIGATSSESRIGILYTVDAETIEDVVKVHKALSGSLRFQLAEWTRTELCNWENSASNGIDMTHYPGGWEDGKIKWVKLIAEEIEQQKAELSTLESEAAQAQTGDRSESQAMCINHDAVSGCPSTVEQCDDALSSPNSSVRNSVAAGESSTSMGDNVSPAWPRFVASEVLLKTNQKRLFSGLNTDNATPASSATHTGTEPAATMEVSSSSSRGANS
ncbi:uncharacterized protein EI90DRAFT_3130893 [Cantharellus anzutake]|uniref:uncharacterized protein n=1 Tax=Cantharellus anzutake TaxID=1750568 RepID=UPI0019067302|nr:uncharacterized protein EI90DRAFT_3130893 [Cantharellus anzutake]KAF8322790.1 hypothetical protein EI90DRAFT_3130893 [Cantharellus anzutake]